MLNVLAIANYRSLRDLIVPLGALNVVTGPNGSGKSSLYRALRLLAETSRGGLVSSLAREGGLQSTLWAGPETISAAMRAGKQPVQGSVRKDRIQLRLGFASDDYGFAVDLGLPVPNSRSAFSRDPELKRECIWSGPVFRPSSLLVDRRGPALRYVSENGAWETVPTRLPGYTSMMTEFADPRSVPEMIRVRERMRSWRFYDHFDTSMAAPARQPQVGTHTPVLGDDGSDVAAALQTIREIGDHEKLDHAVEDAFPGASVHIRDTNGRFELAMKQHGLLRPLAAGELSDGTLRYLILIAVLLTPRPPELLVLNEPETSLHPDLIPALGRLIADAARQSQIVVVSHDRTLVGQLRNDAGAQAIALEKRLSETVIEGNRARDRPRWEWPPR